MDITLENYIESTNYNDLEDWQIPNIEDFSESKKLYDYQAEAIKKAIITLHNYYTDKDWCKNFYTFLKERKVIENEYDLLKVDQSAKNSFFKNRKFNLFSDYYIANNDSVITGEQFFNRMCFWMATASGKTIVIIKLIEAIKYLQSKGLIPNNDILLLFPRDDLIEQFKAEIASYNKGKSKKLTLFNLKQYDNETSNYSLFTDSNIYYYRSDLVRDTQAENFIDFKNYYNGGKWFVFLDEAHRGQKDTSLLQDYVSILSSNGFLFNFSATFTEAIDYITTCYNFNLQKFISRGYGKNIYLSQSYFDFKQENMDYTSEEKTKQVLKSLIVLTLAKKNHVNGYYHNPLLMTLVNSVNTSNSDLLLFFKKIEEIASGTININILDEAKNDLISEFLSNKRYMFGNEDFSTNLDVLRNIKLEDIFEEVFNSKTHGKIQLIRGERGKEYALQLETASTPFALIKIGDADKFQKEKLGDNYILINSYETNKKFFNNLNNENSTINILVGSRSFYEGWDSNRPNVINLINIGGSDAKKFVLQSIGRGIRIEPQKGIRTRLPIYDENKNTVLETLFVFSTNKGAVRAILDAIDKEKGTDEYVFPLKRTPSKFKLLIPEYGNINNYNYLPRFNISENRLEQLKEYFSAHRKELFMLKFNISDKLYEVIKYSFANPSKYYQYNNRFNYDDMDILAHRIINHFRITIKDITNVSEIKDDTITHFNNVKLLNTSANDAAEFRDDLNSVMNYSSDTITSLIADFQSGKISQSQFTNRIPSNKKRFKDLEIVNMENHYFSPIIYSSVEQIDYAKNIISKKSESDFISALKKYISQNTLNFEWMFSKLEENTDSIYIPYYDGESNKYSNFYPDFIFWLKSKNRYKIIFVDPKGTSHSSYQNKVDGFNRIFTENGVPKHFIYDDLDVSFDLKLITGDTNKVGELYRKYWLAVDDFSWLSI